MSQTIYQKFDKPADREALLELFLQQRIEEFGAVFGNAHIEGLQLEWVSATSIKVKKGAADIPDGSRRLRVSSDITVSSISLGASVWGHVYLYNNAGLAAVEVVTTAPANYFGSAYQKTGAATRRYLGSVRTDGSGNIYNFLHVGPWMKYRVSVNLSPFRVLSSGTATSETSVSASAVVPVTSRLASLKFTNTTPNANSTTGTSDDSITFGGGTYGIATAGAGGSFFCDHPLNSSQAFTYLFDAAPASGGLLVDVLGYLFDR
jgi:hypothetical protein